MNWFHVIVICIALMLCAERIAKSLESVCPSGGTEFIEAYHKVPL